MSLKECLIAAVVVFVATFGYQTYEHGGFTPIPAGPKRVVILHETDLDMPKDAAMWGVLRNGEAAAYFSGKQEKFDIMDVTDNPLYQQGMDIPSLLILDASSGSVVYKQNLPDTAAGVLEAVKAHGG